MSWAQSVVTCLDAGGSSCILIPLEAGKACDLRLLIVSHWIS
ncbi:MAG: hypothetical protein ACK5ZV_07325 [bacterium]